MAEEDKAALDGLVKDVASAMKLLVQEPQSDLDARQGLLATSA